MTEYVCPVGALTATDFRFKARVWFLRSVRAVCQGCATGCNSFVDYDPRHSKVQRQRPRENPEVNKYWMCDEGVLDYRRVHENRVLDARVDREEVPVDAALKKAAGLLKPVPGKRVALLLSAEHSVEDNYALLRLGESLGSTGRFIAGRPPGEADDVLRHADKNPNRQGAIDLCGTEPPGDFAALGAALNGGKFDYVLALGSQIESNDGLAALSTFAGLIDFGSHEGPLTRYARVGLPAATSAEASGTYVNVKGLSQASERAIRPLGSSRPAWKLISLLSEKLEKPLGWKKLADLRRALEGGDAKDSAEAALNTGATP
jgi:NADH-quinone oxidoreductase subunit G